MSTLLKVDALRNYFLSAPPEDAAWALYFLSGRTLKRLLPTAVLIEAGLSASACPRWLFDECYSDVGDMAETLSLLVPAAAEAERAEISLRAWVEDRLLPLKGEPPAEQSARIRAWWCELGTREIFLVNKLLTGSFRAGVSQTLVVRALAQRADISEALMAHRLMGKWDPTAAFFTSLAEKKLAEKDPGTPYPFYLASPLEAPPESLGGAEEWLAEWKWDGIRAQAIHRDGAVFLWSRGEELITDRFPEISGELHRLPRGTVLDGEVLAYAQGAVLPFSSLQQRIGRKKLTPKILEQVPVTFMVFDLVEENGEDLRARPLSERRARLTKLIGDTASYPHLQISPPLAFPDWNGLAETRAESREKRVEGVMLKRLSSPYKTGRKRGDWWKWKVEPFTMDAVLVYAQAGHGRRATLYTDYTFAIWKGKELVPIAKAYSGLTDVEILEMDRWIRKNTKKKFGPVREVPPERVFELAFEGIALSPRHKSGLAVRFPRILRRREDKKPEDADSVDRIQELLRAQA